MFVIVISKRAITEFKSENGMLEILVSNKYGILILCFLTFYDNIFFTFIITFFYILIRKNRLIEIITYSINTIKRKDGFHLD